MLIGSGGGLKLGETVLIEHDSLTSPARGVYHAVKWAGKRGYKVVVDDVLDTLYLYVTHLKLAGFDVSVFNNLSVIKEGGLQDVGEVVQRLRFKEYAIRKAEYERVFEPILSGGGRVLNLVLGIEKLFLISDLRENINTVNAILGYTGDERRIALYFINKDLLEVSGAHLLPLLEEIATTVVRVNKEGKSVRFSVVKSVNPEIEGIDINV
ncbi:DUF257 family protein [Thermococcus sp. Bubb.Bath]|uniref:DUF257 family protein n=1 Tax=Thermococcus sp. Bubb.Bath TaxID=1638242 RepID=UPI00143B881C|nr:DUF257 family protein [Thermococcus sp. Bubb.Bath]NJF24641.1 hypothetical protein [Thermococcus sp. Bubb.Bath]